jgi:hypothetical protein
MITPGRHRPLVQDVWNEAAVRAVIEDIAADAVANFHPDTFWPAHPSDDGKEDGDPSFYTGAAGVIWAISLWAGGNFGPISYSGFMRVVVVSLTALTLAIQIASNAFLASIFTIRAKS